MDRRLMIAAPSSNTGKTFISLALLRAIGREEKVRGYKVGPDYIDADYLSQAAGRPAENLDLFLMDEKNINRALAKDGFKIIEGVMGYFDGLQNTYEYSCYDLSKRTNTPVVIVYEPKGESFTAIPKIKGMVDFSGGQIKGIIFNKTSQKMYELLKTQVEKYIGISVLGYLPYDDRLNIKSKNQGLLLPHEQRNFMDLLEVASELVAHHLDMDELKRIAECEDIEVDETDKNYASDLKDIKIAYAHDQAFPFFYNFEGRENFIPFSPLKDKKLPEADLILIGGGYPEDFIADLEMNIDMKESIKSYVEVGGKLIAYGGGLMYLAEKFQGHNMVGIFKGSAQMTDRLQNFGYCELKAKEDLGFAKAGEILRAREFHRGIFESDEKTIFEISKPGRDRKWEDGYKYKNAYGFFAHFHPLTWMDRLIDFAKDK